MTKETEIEVGGEQEFSHSVHIEQSAFGARVKVYVATNNGSDALEQAVAMYRATRLELAKFGEVVAPIEAKKNGGVKA
jgi:hypothetical protein